MWRRRGSSAVFRPVLLVMAGSPHSPGRARASRARGRSRGRPSLPDSRPVWRRCGPDYRFVQSRLIQSVSQPGPMVVVKMAGVAAAISTRLATVFPLAVVRLIWASGLQTPPGQQDAGQGRHRRRKHQIQLSWTRVERLDALVVYAHHRPCKSHSIARHCRTLSEIRPINRDQRTRRDDVARVEVCCVADAPICDCGSGRRPRRIRRLTQPRQPLKRSIVG